MIEYILKARGRASVRETIVEAYAAHTASERAKQKALAMGKLQMLIDLDIISARDAGILEEDIKKIPLQALLAVEKGRQTAGASEPRCLDIGTGTLLTASEFNALIAAGYIRPVPRDPAAPVVNSITVAWQQTDSE